MRLHRRDTRTDAEQLAYWQGFGPRRTPFHPAVVAFARPKVELMITTIERELGPRATEGLSALDVGAGNGFFSVWLNVYFAKVVALDFSSHMLSMNPTASKVRANAALLPFSDASFDVVFASNLLHHVPDPATTLAEMGRVARRFVILSEPNRNHPLMLLFGLAIRAERGALRFSGGYLDQLAREAGLEVVSRTRQGLIVPNKTPEGLVPWFTAVEPFIHPRFFHLALCRPRPRAVG